MWKQNQATFPKHIQSAFRKSVEFCVHTDQSLCTEFRTETLGSAKPNVVILVGPRNEG